MMEPPGHNNVTGAGNDDQAAMLTVDSVQAHATLQPPFDCVYREDLAPFLTLRETRNFSHASRIHRTILGNLDAIAQLFERDHGMEKDGLQLPPCVRSVLKGSEEPNSENIEGAEESAAEAGETKDEEENEETANEASETAETSNAAESSDTGRAGDQVEADVTHEGGNPSEETGAEETGQSEEDEAVAPDPWLAHKICRAALRRRLLVVGEEHVSKFLPRCTPMDEPLDMIAVSRARRNSMSLSNDMEGRRTKFIVINETESEVYCHWIDFEGNILVRDGDRIEPGGFFDHNAYVSHAFVLCREEGSNPFALYQIRRSYNGLSIVNFNTERRGQIEQIHSISLKALGANPVIVEQGYSNYDLGEGTSLAGKEMKAYTLFPLKEELMLFAGVQFLSMADADWPDFETLARSDDQERYSLFTPRIRRVAYFAATYHGQFLWENCWSSWHDF